MSPLTHSSKAHLSPSAIVPRMPLIAAIREAERWTPTNVVGALFLLAVVAVLAYWLLKRYLNE